MKLNRIRLNGKRYGKVLLFISVARYVSALGRL